jgi:hypothetical protein
MSGTGSGCESSGMVGQLLIRVDFQKTCGAVRRKVVHNILIEFNTRVKIFPATKIDLKGFYWLKVHTINVCLLHFLLQGNVKKKAGISLSLLFKFALE